MKTKLTLLTVLAASLFWGGCASPSPSVSLGEGLLWLKANHVLKTDSSTKYSYSMLPEYSVPRTISFWMNPSKLPGEAKLFYGQGLGIGMNGGRVKVYWYVSGWNGGKGPIWVDAPKDNWTHVISVVYWVEGTIRIAAYRNGQLIQEIDTGRRMVGALGPGLEIGWGGEGSGLHFVGKLSNIRIYNRALSTDEVKALYDLEKPKDETAEGPSPKYFNKSFRGFK